MTFLFPLAFVAGVISFSSPCCLPLLPGYLAHIASLVSDAPRALIRSRVLLGALLFVAGFTLVFAALGLSFALLGGALASQRALLMQVAGLLILGMAALQITGWRPGLFSATRVTGVRPVAGMAGSFPLGMAFAGSWTPCVGPVLAAILTAASAEASAMEGGFLLVVYALGLGLPFILSAVALERLRPLRVQLMRAHRQIEIAGGVVLGAMGLLILSGEWLRLMGPLLRWYAELNWPPF